MNYCSVILTAFTIAALHSVASDPVTTDPPQPPSRSDKAEQVIVVCKTHFDIGYTHRVKDIVSYYRGPMITRALDNIDRSADLPPEQQFTWISPGWVMKQVTVPGQDQSPELRNRLNQAIQSGRILTHAMPFTLEADCLDAEPMARGFVFSDFIARQYGQPLSRSAKSTDVPSQPGALATVLARGGVDFIHIGCNWPSGYVHDLPPLFWWEGPDGDRVMCMYSPIYSSSTACNPWGMHEGSPGKIAPHIGVNLIPPEGWPYKTWPAIIVTGDNQGPPSEQEVRSLFKEVHQKRPDLKVRMGSLDEFAQAILKENPTLPVVKLEMPDTWIHGVMSDPRGIEKMRRTGAMLPAYEMLYTEMTSCWGMEDPGPGANKQIADAFEYYLLYGEHTWGRSPQVTIFGEQFRKSPRQQWADLENSWEDKSNYINQADATLQNLRTQLLTHLVQELKVDNNSLLVYNPLPWKRSGQVEINGQIVEVQDIPASGCKIVPLPHPDQPTPTLKCGSNFLENDFFRVVCDQKTGQLISIYDKKLNREWIDPKVSISPGAYMNERFDKNQTDRYCRDYQQGRWGNTLHPGMSKPGLPADVPYRAIVAQQGRIHVQQHPGYGEITISTPADPQQHLPASERVIRLGAHTPYLDFRVSIKGKDRDNWPEADWAVFPFQIDHPTFTVSRPLGFMNPATDIARGANKMLYSTGNGVLMRDRSGEGIVVQPLDHPLVSIGTPGIWKFSLDYKPTHPIVYVNLYNNMWNTNFRYWYEGDWSSRIRVWTVGAKVQPNQALQIPGWESRMPLQAVRGTIENGSTTGTLHGIEVSTPGVIVSAFGKDPINQRLRLRLWNMTETHHTTTVQLPAGMKATSVQPTDLRGQPTGDTIPVKQGQFTIGIDRFAPASFVIQLTP